MIIIVRAKSSKQYSLTSVPEFVFALFKSLYLDTKREFQKVFKNNIKMVLQVILRRKTTSVNIFQQN